MLARGYIIEDDQFSFSHMNYLDVTIFKVPDGASQCRLRYTMFRKPSGQKIPLHGSSGHHPSVHKSWPTGEIRRCFARCSSPVDAKKEVARFVSTLHKFWFDAHLIKTLQASTPLTKPDPTDLSSERLLMMEVTTLFLRRQV